MSFVDNVVVAGVVRMAVDLDAFVVDVVVGVVVVVATVGLAACDVGVFAVAFCGDVVVASVAS